MLYIAIIFTVLIVYFLYMRYVPVRGIPCVDQKRLNQEVVKLDVRDYAISAKENIANSIPIPVAYLKRHHHQIPNRKIYVIASDTIEKNMGIRFLKQRKYKIAGYTIVNSTCRCKKWFEKFV